MKALQCLLVACLSTLLLFSLAGASILYDSNGFEGFAVGDLNGQDGWTAEGSAGGTAPQVVTAPFPVLGTKAVLLQVPDLQGSVSMISRSIPTVIPDRQTIITVSFDIYRQTSHWPLWPQNLWWYWWDAGQPTYGLQWDVAGNQPFQTLPHGWNPGASSTLTIFGQYANIKMVWDFSTMRAYSWYNGALVDNGIPITDISTLSGWTIFLGHDAATGTSWDTVLVDNFSITSGVPLIPVIIDIKPGSEPNSINLKSRGVVPVAVLSTEDFDASTVDPITVKFADASPVKYRMEDVDLDGDLDLLLHFRTQDLNLNENSTEATLTGRTYQGKDIQGTDSVRIVGKRKGE